MQSLKTLVLIQCRKMKGKGPNLALADNYVESILGTQYMERNKTVLPPIFSTLYQEYSAAYLLNASLRRGRISPFISELSQDLANAIQNHCSLNTNLVVFRGIPLSAFHPLTIRDPAFNSVSLDPNMALYFGDCLLIIHLNKDDKMLYLNNNPNYADVFEFLLPPNREYSVISWMDANIGDKAVRLVEVKSRKGSSLDLEVVPGFDIEFVRGFSLIGEFIRPNIGSQIKLRSVLHYSAISGEKEDWYEYLSGCETGTWNHKSIIEWFDNYYQIYIKPANIFLVSFEEAVKAPMILNIDEWQKKGYQPVMIIPSINQEFPHTTIWKN